jgi:hypothetical protein
MAEAPHPPGPAEDQRRAARRSESLLLGGLAGMAAVTAATIALAVVAAVIAVAVAWLT